MAGDGQSGGMARGQWTFQGQFSNRYDQKKKSNIQYFEVLDYSLRKEPEIEGIKTVVHLALLISILILVLLVSLFALLSNDPI